MFGVMKVTGPAAAAVVALLVTAPVSGVGAAETAGNNIVRNATDAFGLRVGTESIGLYDTDNVRGFSPESAGNVRVEGLYISQQGWLSDRVVDSSVIRVGLNNIGYLFPAPSGIAELTLRRAVETGAEVTLGLDSFRSPYVEVDAGHATPDGRFSLSAGVAFRPDQNAQGGADERQWSAGLVPRWQLGEAVTVTAFADWEQMHDGEVIPTYLPDGPYLPPRIKRGIDQSVQWADWAYAVESQGLILDAELGDGLQARAGLFRSVMRLPYDAFALLAVDQGRVGEMVHVLFPATRDAALSGEASLAYRWQSGQAEHVVSLVGRGLSKDSRKGGEVEVTTNPWPLDMPPHPATPDLGPWQSQDRDRVQQFTLGLAYNLTWDERLDFGVGVQKADYAKTNRPANGPRAKGTSAPWLYNAMAAWRFDNGLVAYASYSRGLEESGTAPITAVNRTTVLPAVRTTQREMGVRMGLGPLTLTSSAFDVRRPYDGVDAAGLYGFLGDVRHRGVEASLSGQPVDALSVVIGAVWLDPVVSGAEVRAGTTGRRPVGQSRLQWQASLDYAPEFLGGYSADLTLDHRARTTARSDNRADAPAVTRVDLGLRRDVQVAERTISLRAQVQNLFDAYGWAVIGDGEYEPLTGRSWRLAMSIGF